MIPFDFEYYKPTTIKEALLVLHDIESQGKRVTLYSGGTEFITFSRVNKDTTDVVIDIKGIPECNVLEIRDDYLIIGAGVSLNQIIESNIFPLLGQTVQQIADHTSRNKITIGGNLTSKLMYREAILPLLLAETKVKMADSTGAVIFPLEEVFDKEMKIGTNQFLVQLLIKKEYTDYRFVHFKRTKRSKIGYPIVSLAALVKDKQIRAAFSGVCEYPFRSLDLELILNNTSISIVERSKQTIKQLPSPILDDIQASREFREYVFINALQDTLGALNESIS